MRHHSSADSEQPVDLAGTQSPPPLELHGWASDIYALAATPPVVINPQAEALSLLSWGLGQLQQCNALLDALADGDVAGRGGAEHSAGAAIFHFSLQAETALRAGVAMLHAAECARRRAGTGGVETG